MKSLLTFIVALSLATQPLFASEDEAPALSWDDLVPEIEMMDNPFRELSIEQTIAFRKYLLELEVPEMEHTEDQQKRQRELRESLEADGLEPDELVETYKRLMENYRLVTTSTRPDILGKKVRIPGYLLPLTVKDGAVTEFLLVPTVGACIHTPPPPANQMVYVQFDSGFESPGLFRPVWISGELKAEDRTENLTLVDGSSDIHVTYAMNADDVTIYSTP